MKKSKYSIADFYNRNSKSIRPFVIIIGALITMLFAVPDKIRYTKSVTLSWFFVIIVATIFLLLRKSLQPLNLRKEIKKLILYSSMFAIVGISFYGHLLISKLDIERNGVKSTGVIVEKSYIKGRKGKRGNWMITCNFSVNGKDYMTYREKDNQHKYRIGDTLVIEYSSINPDNSRIIFPKSE